MDIATLSLRRRGSLGRVSSSQLAVCVGSAFGRYPGRTARPAGRLGVLDGCFLGLVGGALWRSFGEACFRSELGRAASWHCPAALPISRGACPARISRPVPGDRRRNVMKNTFSIDLADRLRSATVAKRSRLDQMRPTPARPDPLHAERGAMRQQALQTVRAERLAERAARQLTAVGRVAHAPSGACNGDGADLASGAEAKAKRDKRYAARKARA